jgi:hypothetical protein
VLSNAGAWSSIPSVLAHQGGWDEILLIVGPMALVVALLWLAKRRVTAAASRPEGHADHDPGTRSLAAPTDRSRPTKSS